MLHPTGIVANRRVTDIEAAREFWVDFVGLRVETLGLDWVTRLTDADGRAQVQLVTADATAPVDSDLSVLVGDAIEDAWAEAQARGLDIVHPLTTEDWGVRRFFVRSPDGTVLNIVSHVDR